MEICQRRASRKAKPGRRFGQGFNSFSLLFCLDSDSDLVSDLDLDLDLDSDPDLDFHFDSDLYLGSDLYLNSDLYLDSDLYLACDSVYFSYQTNIELNFVCSLTV